MMNRAMFDIETAGRGPHAAIVSVACVLFDPDLGTCDERPYYGAVDLHDPQIGVPDMDTLAWWLDQDPDVMRREFHDQPRFPLRRVLTQAFTYAEHTVEVWSKAPTFDLRLLREAGQRCEVAWPWEFRADRCYRTLRALAKQTHPNVDFEVGDDGPKHSGLADCYRQATGAARYIQRLLHPAAP